MKNRTIYFIWAVRIFLALVFIGYGALKIAGGQFYHGDFVLDSRTNYPTTLVWAFFGYSYLYSTFIGLGEVVAGALLLHPRTATLGAVMYFPIALNVTMIDLSYGFPLPATALIITLTLLCAGLLWHDRRKLLMIFWQREGSC